MGNKVVNISMNMSTDMTLEEAIKHCKEKGRGCDKCADEHRQLAEWLKELQSIKKNAIEQKPNWSEDDKMVRIIEDAICTNEAQQLVKTKYGLELTNLADWLENQGSQKPAWSEEDEYVYNEILKRVEKKKLCEHDLEYIYNWLKSLRPQNRWKPSDEQIDMDKLGEIARHLIAVKNHIEDMRLDKEEWSALEKIGYPERFKSLKE